MGVGVAAGTPDLPGGRGTNQVLIAGGDHLVAVRAFVLGSQFTAHSGILGVAVGLGGIDGRVLGDLDVSVVV